MSFIKEEQLNQILKTTQNPTKEQVLSILEKAKKLKGLKLEEVGTLLNTEDEELIEKIFETAGRIKLAIYGRRLVLFAPLYISSYCVNDCDYCGFHCRNRAPRKKLSLDEVREQVEILEDMGHKRLLLEFGEHPVENPIDYVVEVIKTIYSVKKGFGSIRRVNVNIAATSVEAYKKLKAAGIGTYQLFQETYHQPTYEKLHHGPKADYERQLYAMNRAYQGGIDDLGIGVLFGLYDYKFEVLAIVAHADFLEKTNGVGPHTISVPRFRPAETVTYQPEYPVEDKDFLKLIAILRLAVPYTGMIMSTRETPEIRRKAFQIGISQTSAGSRTSPGGYKIEGKEGLRGKEEQIPQLRFHPPKQSFCGGRVAPPPPFSRGPEQFQLNDHRSLDEVVRDICAIGYFPSFCTACYRVGRTGDYFMSFAKTGNIQNFCQPNAILTFKEYLLDYASKETKRIGEEAILKTKDLITDDKVKEELERRLKRLEAGERDLYF